MLISALIKTRSIHDNFKLIEMTAKAQHRHKKAMVLLKLDISKAFDTVDWTFFLLKVLQAMGFGTRWRRWILALVSPTSTSILLNAELGNKITTRGSCARETPLPDAFHLGHGGPSPPLRRSHSGERARLLATLNSTSPVLAPH